MDSLSATRNQIIPNPVDSDGFSPITMTSTHHGAQNILAPRIATVTGNAAQNISKHLTETATPRANKDITSSATAAAKEPAHAEIIKKEVNEKGHYIKRERNPSKSPYSISPIPRDSQEDDNQDNIYLPSGNTTIKGGEAVIIECFLQFEERLPKNLKKIPPTGVKSVAVFSANKQPDAEISYDDRTLVVLINASRNKDFQYVTKSGLRRLRDFDTHDLIKVTREPAGEPAWIATPSGMYYLAYAETVALWGKTEQARLQCNPIHSSYKANASRVGRLILSAVKSPRPPKDVRGKPLEQLGAELFSRFTAKSSNPSSRSPSLGHSHGSPKARARKPSLLKNSLLSGEIERDTGDEDNQEVASTNDLIGVPSLCKRKRPIESNINPTQEPISSKRTKRNLPLISTAPSSSLETHQDHDDTVYNIFTHAQTMVARDYFVDITEKFALLTILFGEITVLLKDKTHPQISTKLDNFAAVLFATESLYRKHQNGNKHLHRQLAKIPQAAAANNLQLAFKMQEFDEMVKAMVKDPKSNMAKHYAALNTPTFNTAIGSRRAQIKIHLDNMEAEEAKSMDKSNVNMLEDPVPKENVANTDT